jgi:Phosphoesterase family/Glycosyl hydrolase family 99
MSMQHSQAWYRRTSAWVLALLMLASIGIVIGLVAPAPSVAKDRTLVVHARADATVFGRYPHRNFGNRPRLVVGAVPGGSRIYTTFAVPDLGDLVLDDATLVLRTLGPKHRIDVRRTGSHWHEMRITPANAPAGWHTLGVVARGRAHVMHLDVTDLVERSEPTLSLLLRTDGPRTVFASSESGRGPKIKIHGHVPEPTPTPTTTPTGSPDPSATATPTPTGGGDLQPSLPIRAAFYYPWFPETWGPSSDRFTNYHPSLGWYDSSDVGVVSQHIAAMQYGGIQAGISSWWGQGTKTDQRVPTLLRAADGTTFRWTLYYEQEAQGDPSVAQIHDDLTYITNHYGSDPSFLRIDGRPVVFVYADGSDGCGMASRWGQANTVNAYVVLKVFPGYKTCADQPASWHQYGPASATSDMSPYSFTISPGFWKKGESSPRLTRDLSRWSNQVAAMASSNARFQLITTFNEWGEGTAIESAGEWSSGSGYGKFLDVLHGLPVDPSPTPTSTSASPTPTSPSPTATSSSTSPPPTTNPIVVIYMENKERSSVLGSSSAQYQNSLRGQGIDFTHAYGVTHPSLPNYLALGNGATNGKQGTDSISAGELSASPTLWNQLQNAGISWGVYEEDMPAVCSGATTSGLYALKHNPATPFGSVYHDAATCGHVQPFSAFDVTHMPKVSFVAPNLCNDEHDCGLSTGDGWLQAHVQPMLANGATVILTYDEGSTSAGINGTSGGGNIYTVVVGPHVSARVDAGQYNQYSILAAIEARFGLTRLNGAANAAALPLS